MPYLNSSLMMISEGMLQVSRIWYTLTHHARQQESRTLNFRRSTATADQVGGMANHVTFMMRNLLAKLRHKGPPSQCPCCPL